MFPALDGRPGKQGPQPPADALEGILGGGHDRFPGRHTGDFVTYQPDTTIVDAVMPPTGKAFAITQTHWFRTRDGMITGHWANRDDLAMARQAGWVPPSPGFLLRAALAKRRARKRPA